MNPIRLAGVRLLAYGQPSSLYCVLLCLHNHALFSSVLEPLMGWKMHFLVGVLQGHKKWMIHDCCIPLTALVVGLGAHLSLVIALLACF
jgi:hypothetical protein